MSVVAHKNSLYLPTKIVRSCPQKQSPVTYEKQRRIKAVVRHILLSWCDLNFDQVETYLFLNLSFTLGSKCCWYAYKCTKVCFNSKLVLFLISFFICYLCVCFMLIMSGCAELKRNTGTCAHLKYVGLCSVAYARLILLFFCHTAKLSTHHQQMDWLTLHCCWWKN